FFEFRATLESSFRAGGNYRCGTATFFRYEKTVIPVKTKNQKQKIEIRHSRAGGNLGRKIYSGLTKTSTALP
ncbi:TPA: hypothetical protein ACJJRR_002218, partial [Neisseria meningitidis]